jgi:hypothetical protein
VLTTITEVPSIRNLAGEQCGEFLHDLQLKVPHLLAIGAADLEGRVVCQHDVASTNLNIADRSYFVDAIASTGPVVGEYTLGRVERRPVLPIAQALRDPAGRVTGVVVAALDLGWLSGHLSERSLQEGDSVTIADRNGVIVARAPFPERFVGTRIPGVFQHLVDAPAPGALEVTSHDGTRRMLGYVPIASQLLPGLYVSAGIAADNAFAAINRATEHGMALIGLGLAAALLAAPG